MAHILRNYTETTHLAFVFFLFCFSFKNSNDKINLEMFGIKSCLMFSAFSRSMWNIQQWILLLKNYWIKFSSEMKYFNFIQLFRWEEKCNKIIATLFDVLDRPLNNLEMARENEIGWLSSSKIFNKILVSVYSVSFFSLSCSKWYTYV